MTIELTVQIIQIILLFYISVIISFRNTLKKFNKDEFLVNNHLLENIVNTYKDIILEDKQAHLKASHDINPDSKTNSIKLYNAKYNDLLKDSSKEIFRQLSKTTLNNLLTYYSKNGLILHIIHLLKR